MKNVAALGEVGAIPFLEFNKNTRTFRLSQRKESRELFATLSGLEDEIKELQDKGDNLKRGDLTVEDLEQKFKKNFKAWKEEEKDLEGVKK